MIDLIVMYAHNWPDGGRNQQLAITHTPSLTVAHSFNQTYYLIVILIHPPSLIVRRAHMTEQSDHIYPIFAHCVSSSYHRAQSECFLLPGDWSLQCTSKVPIKVPELAPRSPGGAIILFYLNK